MKHSIRTYLLVNLLLSVFLFAALTAIAHLFVDHNKIHAYTNRQLAMMALNIQRLIVYDPNLFSEDNQNNQSDCCEIVQKMSPLQGEANTIMHSFLPNICSKIKLQVSDKNNKIIFPKNPKDKIVFDNNHPGFYKQKIGDVAWHVFTLQNMENGIKVSVAEHGDIYDEINKKMEIFSTWITLLAYPFLILLVWIIVGRGLASISYVTNEVKNRAPSFLQAVDIEGTIPIEIQPLIKEINHLLAKMQEALLREERFASDAAHELRTPLAALRAHVHVAINTTTKKERDRALNNIITGIDRSTHVVNQLLTLSRAIKMKSDTIKLQPVSLHKEATAIIAELVPIAKRNNAEIELIESDTRLMILGDPIMIGVLIKNLIDNSIRYVGHEHGLIQVIVSSTAKNIILKVIDNGPGIPEKQYKRVFERFFRVVGNKVPGSGLGLNIVKQIIQQHHAKITLNTPKNGTGLEVCVYFKKMKVSKTK